MVARRATLPRDVRHFGAVLSHRAAHQPGQIAYTFLKDGTSDEANISFAELHERATAIAAALQHLTEKGDRVLLVFPPGLDFVAAFYGCIGAGVIAVPVYPPRNVRSFEHLLRIARTCEPRAVLTVSAYHDGFADKIRQCPGLAALEWMAVDTLAPALSGLYRPPQVDPDDIAFLQYTSGSTGVPKGVMVSHRNLLVNARIIRDKFGLCPDALVVGWLPFYHDMGLIGHVLEPMFVGFRSIFFSPLHFLQRPTRWLRAISRYGATISGGPNFAYDLCVRRVTEQEAVRVDLSTWDLAYCGAEPIRPATIESFSRRFGGCGFRRTSFYPCYGLAEATLMVTGTRREDPPEFNVIGAHAAGQQGATVVNCGTPPADHQVRIVDPDTLAPCPDGSTGEVWVAGPTVARGYWGDDDATRDTFMGVLPGTGEGPFLRTGDLGMLGQTGLHVTGRLKDLIIVRGQNYYPHDIERVVQGAHPSLRLNGGAAFSVDIDNEERLIIAQEIEHATLRSLAATELVHRITEAIVDAFGISPYDVLLLKPGSLPRTLNGKLPRTTYPALYLDDALATERAVAEPAPVQP